MTSTPFQSAALGGIIAPWAAKIAELFGIIVEIILALPLRRTLVLNYDQFAACPEPGLLKLISHFRFQVAPATLAAMCRVQATFGPLLPAGDGLDPAQEAEVLGIVGDLPQQLEARCGHPPGAP